MAKVQPIDTEDNSEFDAQATAGDIASGYEATRDADVEDQREYRLIPKGTPCELGIQGFSLDPGKGENPKPAIFVKIEVVEPQEYADGSSNFRKRMSLNSVVAPGKKTSGWLMTRNELIWMYASVTQQDAETAKAELLGPVYEQFPNISLDDVPAFHEALVARLNETMKGETFSTSSIGVEVGGDDGKGGKYGDRQTFGQFVYPKTERK